MGARWSTGACATYPGASRWQTGRPAGGVEFDHRALDRVEKRFWRDIWESVPAEVAAEHGVELRELRARAGHGGERAARRRDDEPGARRHRARRGRGRASRRRERVGRARAASTATSRSPPGCRRPSRPSAGWPTNGFSPGYAWMKFARDAHPPRFAAPDDVEVVEVTDPEQEPFGMIAATGFGLPAWAAAFFADLPGRDGLALLRRPRRRRGPGLRGDADPGRASPSSGSPPRSSPPAAAAASARCCAAASSTPPRPAAAPSSSRPASASPTAPPPATRTSSGRGSKRPTCGRTGSGGGPAAYLELIDD